MPITRIAGKLIVMVFLKEFSNNDIRTWQVGTVHTGLTLLSERMLRMCPDHARRRYTYGKGAYRN